MSLTCQNISVTRSKTKDISGNIQAFKHIWTNYSMFNRNVMKIELSYVCFCMHCSNIHLKIDSFSSWPNTFLIYGTISKCGKNVMTI